MKQRLTDSSILLFNFALWVRNLQTGTMLFDEKRKKKYFLNTTASFILSGCDGTKPVGEVIRKFHATFSPVTEAHASADVLNLLRQLLKYKIVVIQNNN